MSDTLEISVPIVAEATSVTATPASTPSAYSHIGMPNSSGVDEVHTPGAVIRASMRNAYSHIAMPNSSGVDEIRVGHTVIRPI